MSVDPTASTVLTSNIGTSVSKNSISGKATSDTSFKEEMSKVSSDSDKTEDSKQAATDNKKECLDVNLKNEDNNANDEKLSENNQSFNSELNKDDESGKNIMLSTSVEQNNLLSLNSANNMLENDILQIMNNNLEIANSNKILNCSFEGGTKFQFNLNESDAQFFINLTQTNDISMQNIAIQGQNLLNNGSDISQVRQNIQVSQSLLNALNDARQNNQPIRIDFDQNIAVILRVGKDGSISANFIPGDKAVEQYLRNNINSLKAAFNEKDLPYSELSYSNSSKRQNEHRRNKQQGEQ